MIRMHFKPKVNAKFGLPVGHMYDLRPGTSNECRSWVCETLNAIHHVDSCELTDQDQFESDEIKDNSGSTSAQRGAQSNHWQSSIRIRSTTRDGLS